MSTNTQQLKQGSNQWIEILNDPRAHIILHLIGWFFLFLILLFTSSANHFSDAFASAAFLTLLLSMVVYINHGKLVPRFFSKNRYIVWALSYTISCILAALIFMGLLELFEVDIRNSRHFGIHLAFFVILSFLMLIGKFILEYFMNYVQWENKATQLDSEVKLLRAQVNPHFLFNSLNSIYSLALEKDDRAPEITMKLSQIMRYMVDRAHEDKILLKEEVNYLRDYLDLEKLRTGDKAEISFEVNGETDFKMVEPLLLIPFVENAFKHGINTLKSGGVVRINLECKAKQITFTCINNFNSSIKKESTGTGINNVRKRLERLYPGRYDLFINKEDAQFKVVLNLYLQ
ncbi:sensor histidine kinase [Fulvivirgaceae bacterium LMO-SS25]